MKKLLAALLALSLITTGVTVYASDTSDAVWSGTVRVTNNSTAATVVATVFTANTTTFINNGYMNDSGNNTAWVISGSDGAYMPGYVGNPWVIFLENIGANAIVDTQLYMGGDTDMEGKLAIFGTLSVPDTMTEFGDNFTASISTYVNTTTSAMIWHKPLAFAIANDDSGNVTAGIYQTTTYTNISSADSAEGAFVEYSFTTALIDGIRIRLFNSDVGPEGVQVNEMQVWNLETSSWELPITAAGTGWTNPTNAIDGNTGTFSNATAGASSYSTYLTVTLNSLVLSDKVRVWTTDPSGFITTKDIDIAYADSVTVSGVTSDDVVIIAQEDSANFWLTVDGSPSANLTAAVVPNTANATVLAGVSTPYILSANVTEGGNLAGSWAWNYGATITDLSGNGNDATPTFRTTSSDADVSAELVSFTPISEADAPAYTVTDPPDFVTDNITVSGTFSSNTTSSTAPGVDVIDAISQAGDTPTPFILYLLMGFIIIVLSFSISYFMRTGGSSSLVIKILFVLALMGLLVALDIFDSWTLYLFAMISFGIAFVASNRQVQGTGNFGNNLIGFLIMAWLGLTVINNILEGAILTTTNQTAMNDFLIFQPWNVAGFFTLPVPSVRFLTVGLPALMEWNYTAFGGQAQMFTYLMYSVSGVVAFLFFTVAMAAAANMFFRSR